MGQDKAPGICLPTYNEADNLGNIIEKIYQYLPDAYILIIDDNSQDGTGELADRFAVSHQQISVLHRQRKEGLGFAYIDGFKTILRNPNVDPICQMDADLSHPVDRLVPMIENTHSKDLILGSRYVSGGQTQNWNLFRKLISRFGSLYARKWLSIPIMDLTGGFKVWRRSLLEQIIRYPLSGEGYVFQVETTYLAYRIGARINELPITFTERVAGKSKMSASIAFEAFWKIPQMRFKKIQTINI